MIRSYETEVGPTSNVTQVRREETQTQTCREDGRLKTEAEIGVKLSQTRNTKDCQPPPEARIDKKELFLKPSKGTRPC